MSPASVLTPSRNNRTLGCPHFVWSGRARCIALIDCNTSDAVVAAPVGMLQEAR